MSGDRSYVCAFLGRRDYYQIPVALAEGDCLDTFLTDAYFKMTLSEDGILPRRLAEKMRFRHEEAIPADRVTSCWDLSLRRELGKLRGLTDYQIFASLDAVLSRRAAATALKNRSNLLLYNPYAWEAFTRSYPHSPRKVLFQFHPHPDLERRILADDTARHDLFEYSYEQEAGEDADPDVKRRTRDVWRHADLIMCASGFTRHSLIEAGAEPDRCVVIPYGIDCATSPKLEPPSSFKVLFVGSGTQRKGLHHLLMAWQRAKLAPGSELTVVCRFIDGGLRRLVADTKGATLVNGLPGGELERMYSSSALFAMPSLVEGFGQVYLEALSQACPVLGTANTGLPDLGGPPAITLVPPGDIEQLTRELERLSCELPGNSAPRQAAVEVARAWPWSRFRSALRAAL